MFIDSGFLEEKSPRKEKIDFPCIQVLADIKDIPTPIFLANQNKWLTIYKNDFGIKAESKKKTKKPAQKVQAR